MCILFWSVDNHPTYKFIFAGNRDEFLGRSTQPAHVWPTYLGSNNDNGTDNEHSPFAAKVIGGTDLDKEASAHNGTWLGITTDGRLAALTNFRETKFDGRLSRGILVRDFLLGTKTTAHNYLDHLKTTADEYGGFSLICFDLSKPTDMAYFSNRDTDDRVQPLAAGKVYGLSNSVLADPWIKVEQGKEHLDALLKDDTLTKDQLIESLFQLLRMTEPFTNTDDVTHLMAGFKERIFIPKINSKILGKGASYGTRTSTVILVDKDDKVTFVERDWYELDDNGSYRECNPPPNRLFSFQLHNNQIDVTE